MICLFCFENLFYKNNLILYNVFSFYYFICLKCLSYCNKTILNFKYFSFIIIKIVDYYNFYIYCFIFNCTFCNNYYFFRKNLFKYFSLLKIYYKEFSTSYAFYKKYNEKNEELELLNPEEINFFLNKFIIGQEKSKK